MASRKTKATSSLVERDYVAIFWSAFTRGCAGMEFDAACVKTADDLGCYRNVSGNTKSFNSNSKFFRDTVACALRAGRIAAGLAAKAKRETISATDFKDAYKTVQFQVFEKNPRARGGLCSGG